MDSNSHPNLLKEYQALQKKVADLSEELKAEVADLLKTVYYPANGAPNFDDYGLMKRISSVAQVVKKLEWNIAKMRALSEASYAVKAPIETKK